MREVDGHSVLDLNVWKCVKKKKESGRLLNRDRTEKLRLVNKFYKNIQRVLSQ
jgi:hypothetical protein